MTQIIRRFILALSLMAGIAPAMAQAPGPVPALPDTERRTSYSISASTCACAVNFALYGDGTDYANWVEVFVNGVQVTQPGNWTLTSPSGSFGSLPRPISDAVLTFAAPQTGTVQIVGARRPRRVSQFSENRGVAARDLNQAITDIVAMLRENWDKTNDVAGRAVLGRPGETLALLPTLANRQNQGACFDSSGNLSSCVTVPSSTFVAGPGIQFTGTNPTTISSSATLYLRPADYGAKCDGTTNDTAAIQSMFNAAAGNAVFFPPGKCIVSTTTLTVPANVLITGAGLDVSIIKTLSCVPLLTVSNVSNVTIENLWLQGSDACVSWGSSPISAINFGSSVAASNWRFRNLRLTNFNGNYWGYGNAAAIVSNVLFDNIFVETTGADSPTTSNASNIGFAFFSSGGTNRWENLSFTNSQFNGGEICIHVILFGNAFKYNISGNRFLNPGGSNTSGHCTNGGGATNAYCASVYDANDDGNPPQDGILANNYCLNPIASGFYFVPGSALTRAATSTPILFSGNEISGQSHTDTQLPRGAVAINTSTDITVVGTKLRGNAIGINAVAQTAGVLSILSNDCYSGAGGSICLNVQAGSNGSSNTDRRIIRDNYFEAGANSVVLVSATGARFNEVDMSGNAIVADSAASGSGLAASAPFISGVLALRNNNFTGPSSTAMMAIGSLTGNLGLSGNAFTVPASGTSGILFSGLPPATNGSDIFVQDGTAASGPCTGGGTGSRAFRQNGAWKCF